MGPFIQDRRQDNSTQNVLLFTMVSQNNADEEMNVKPSDILKKYRAMVAKDVPIFKLEEDTKMAKLTDSLEAINIMSISLGLIRAKNAFKRKISQDAVKVKDIKIEGDKQWEAIEQTFIPTLTLDGAEISSVKNEINPPVKLQKQAIDTALPPPPPPPPPPMPVSKVVCQNPSETKSYIHPQDNIKLVKLHWKCLQVVTNDSLWSNLPDVNIQTEELIKLFQIKGIRKTSCQEVIGRPKEILVLDHKRSNHINIGIKKLPTVSSLKNVILTMDDEKMKRDGIEKLQALIGTPEEIEMIKEAEKNNPEVPLGQAEQYLLALDSITDLQCRLKLWAFKTDFLAIETEILDAMNSLKEGSKTIKGSKIFHNLISLIRSIGNYLNKSRAEGFLIQYLSKLQQVKDTNTKKSLLYHVNVQAVGSGLETGHFLKEFRCLNLVCHTDYEKMKINLKSLEENCKDSLAFVKLANYDSETGEMVNAFLLDASKRVLAMKKVTETVLGEYAKLLEWFGIPAPIHSDYTPMVLAQTLTDFAKDIQEVNNQLLSEENQKNTLKRRVLGKIRRTHSSLDLKMAAKSNLSVPIEDKKNFSSSLESVLQLAITENMKKNQHTRHPSEKSSVAYLSKN